MTPGGGPDPSSLLMYFNPFHDLSIREVPPPSRTHR